jgi:hypothetical protein
MIAVLIGIALIITAVVLWLGGVTVLHAVAILIGLTGVLLVLWWAAPGKAFARRTP